MIDGSFNTLSDLSLSPQLDQLCDEVTASSSERISPQAISGAAGSITVHPFLEHPSPIVFAHRGCHESGPENSFDAFQGAFDKGVRYMETDVHLTLDGHLVAFHDRSLLRMTGAPSPYQRPNVG